MRFTRGSSMRDHRDFVQLALKELGVSAFSFGDTYDSLKLKDESQRPTEEQFNNKVNELKSKEPMRRLREKRSQLIAATDWWVLPDRTPTQAQLDYRQALRDLPASSTPSLDENGNLTGVTWPVKPE